MKLKKDSWKIIELIIMRYPEKKREYEEYISDIMSSSTGTGDGHTGTSPDYTPPVSVTEAKALKMTSAYADRIKKEIEAVEFVYKGLRPEEQIVIYRRWENGNMKCPYRNFEECIIERCPSCVYEEVKTETISGRYPSYMSLEVALSEGYAWKETKISYKFVSCKLVENSVQPIPQKKEVINNTQKTSVVIHKSIF